jgi:hypothetical protein
MVRESTSRIPLAASLLLVAAACSGPAIIEGSASAVTVRYGSMDGIEAATQLAEKTCALHGKTARLRNTANFGLTDRYAHFECI